MKHIQSVIKFVETKESDDLDKQQSYLEREELHDAHVNEQGRTGDLEEIKTTKFEEKNHLEGEMEKSEKSSNISGTFFYIFLPKITKIFILFSPFKLNSISE